MMKKILQTIKEHALLTKDMHVVIGLSGGPDSLCMFDVFCQMAEEWNLKLYPVHVNHKFRPGAAEADQAFVEKYCHEAGWPCRTFVRDCAAIAEEEGLTAEEAGRKVRYEAFTQVALEAVSSCLPEVLPRHRVAIAVGQNGDDQAETVLFRLLRGSGVDGLAGIAYKRWDEEGFAVIRPLLDCSRQEIESYCQQQGLQPRQDHTNEEAIYMRNRIRLQLLPYLREEYNPNITGTLKRLAAAAAKDSDYLWNETHRAWRDVVISEGENVVEFSLHVLDGLHPAIRIRLYHKALEQIGAAEDVTAAHLDGMEAARCSDSPSASWNLPGGCIAEKRYDRFCICRASGPQDADGSCGEAEGLKQLTVRVSAIDDDMREGSEDGETPSLQARFSLGAMKEVYGEEAASQILLRTRQDGDYMMIRTGGGLHRKKLQDMLVDMKIPKSLRDQVKLAAIGKEILWILPGEDAAMARLGKKGRMSNAYPAEDNSGEPIIVLEYLF